MYGNDMTGLKQALMNQQPASMPLPFDPNGGMQMQTPQNYDPSYRPPMGGDYMNSQMGSQTPMDPSRLAGMASELQALQTASQGGAGNGNLYGGPPSAFGNTAPNSFRPGQMPGQMPPMGQPPQRPGFPQPQPQLPGRAMPLPSRMRPPMPQAAPVTPDPLGRKY